MSTEHKPSIMFVDDEVNILRGLRRELRGQRAKWDMQFIESGEEAIESLKQQDINVLVTDMRMPGVDGAELLSWVSFNKPGIVRFILSGEAEPHLTYQTVGRSHRFFSKPCDGPTLIGAIENVVGEVAGRRSSQSNISTMGLLCSPQSIFDEIMRLRTQEAKIDDYIKVVSLDPSLSLRIFQLVNSAYFGAPVTTCSVSRALKAIGPARLVELFMMGRLGESYDDARFGEIYKSLGYMPDQLAMAIWQNVKDRTDNCGLIGAAYACGLFAHLNLLGDLLGVANNPIVPSYHTAVFGLPVELSSALALLEQDELFQSRPHALEDVAARAADYVLQSEQFEATPALQCG